MLDSCEYKFGFERQYDIFGWKRGPATWERRSARWEVLCGREECTKSVAGAQRETEECQINAAEQQCGLRRVHTSRGAPKTWGGGGSVGRNELQVRRSRQRSTQTRLRIADGHCGVLALWRSDENWKGG